MCSALCLLSLTINAVGPKSLYILFYTHLLAALPFILTITPLDPSLEKETIATLSVRLIL
ncbi:uncharacterized protein K460DRAFT_367866 [Cucurbitaria berberidis CBS 394.84]|uniref:Uncharacterized protein n=1 Tax=Cucurbitaria berberidis CBS 394.84 TaxID=1168544 RepID=A0A9P4L651_9PLEO|nr:uncharacterized protein K460DRAFT_367866 [Cucurbitaria berberidis CBS 394.84]KAF1842929.1 hypothetical protein K460DRAFT_367866 [Cucurbitaria berberidis CBS 394.84]